MMNIMYTVIKVVGVERSIRLNTVTFCMEFGE